MKLTKRQAENLSDRNHTKAAKCVLGVISAQGETEKANICKTCLVDNFDH